MESKRVSAKKAHPIEFILYHDYVLIQKKKIKVASLCLSVSATLYEDSGKEPLCCFMEADNQSSCQITEITVTVQRKELVVLKKAFWCTLFHTGIHV